MYIFSIVVVPTAQMDFFLIIIYNVGEGCSDLQIPQHTVYFIQLLKQNDLYAWLLRWWMDVWVRCSRRPQVLLVCHSDEGKEPPLFETLLFCSVGALRSPLQRSPCRCQQRADLFAAVHRWLLRDRETISDPTFLHHSQPFWPHLQLSSSSKS